MSELANCHMFFQFSQLFIFQTIFTFSKTWENLRIGERPLKMLSYPINLFTLKVSFSVGSSKNCDLKVSPSKLGVLVCGNCYISYFFKKNFYLPSKKTLTFKFFVSELQDCRRFFSAFELFDFFSNVCHSVKTVENVTTLYKYLERLYLLEKLINSKKPPSWNFQTAMVFLNFCYLYISQLSLTVPKLGKF